jgi:hypothetical protein
MNPFLLAPSQRLAHWKDFRRGLVSLDLTQQLNAIAEYWSHAPIGRLAFNPDDATTWDHNPWEQIYRNDWCRSSVALGMENTLRLIGVAADRLELQLISDEIHDALLVVIIDDTYVLNYSWGSVHFIPIHHHKVIRKWRFAERGYSVV